jgi:predicted HNH restriction endonuclease
VRIPFEACGYSKSCIALDFHHIDPEKKVSAVGRVREVSNLLDEALKCALLCSNCHREFHGGLIDKKVIEEIGFKNRQVISENRDFLILWESEEPL